MTHMKQWMKQGYRPLRPKGTKLEVEKKAKSLKKKGHINYYKLSKCAKSGEWEVYVK